MPSGSSSTTPPSIRRSGRRFVRSARSSGSHGTLRRWVRRAEHDVGTRPVRTTTEREQLKGLERENFELSRANEILKKASAFFARRSSTAERSNDAFINEHRATY